MTDPILPESTPESQTPIYATKVKFCPQCGSPLLPETTCAFCATNRPPLPGGPLERKTNHSTLRHVILFYTSMLGTSMFFLILSTVFNNNASPFKMQLFISVVFSVVISIFACVHFKSLLGQIIRRFNPLWLLAPAPLAGATGLTAFFLMGFLENFGARNMTILDAFQDVPHGMLWCVLLICVQPAIFEEIAFRGVIHTSLSSILTPVETIIVVGFMFAILHLSIISMPHLALIGLILGWLRVKTGSLIPGMILHFLHNLFVVGIEKYGG